MTTTEATAEFIEAELDLPIRYIDRSRNYYLTLGYNNPYRWAHNTDVPFTPMTKPAKEARIAIVTTAAPYRPEAGNQGAWAPYNAEAKFTRVYSVPIDPAPDLRISHVGYDRKHTSAEDVNSYLPLQRAKEAAAEGKIGILNERIFAVPTLRSQRLTIERDAPEILELAREDRIDAALLVAT